MYTAAAAQLDPQRLFRRFGWLRLRLRITTLVTGLCLTGGAAIGGLALAGWVDWQFHLPGLIRAFVLVGVLCTSGWLAWQHLFEPLRRRTGDLELALEIERRNTHLHDGLASAVQFLHQAPDDNALSSPLLRKVAIRRALRDAESCDFDELIDQRKLARTFFGLAAALVLALPPLLFATPLAQTALLRLLAPFGTSTFPARTTVRLLAPAAFPHRMALGEALEIRAEVAGRVPERGLLGVWLEGTPPAEQTWVIEKTEPTKGLFTARIEPSRVQRNLRIRLQSGDADTGWLDVQVLPPPELAPLDGRPSPQIRLEFPGYSDLPPRQLPAGASSWDAVAGTTVVLRAATNRPIARGWVVYRSENPTLSSAAALAPWAANSTLAALATTAMSQSVLTPTLLDIDEDGREFTVTFTPRLAGSYALRFEEANGFGATRTLDIAVLPDPPPQVNLERPSASFDSLAVTPNADLPLRVAISDSTFAIRSVTAEYHTKKGESFRQRSHYDHVSMGRAWPALLHRLGAPLAGPVPKLRLRPKHLLLEQRLRIDEFQHLDGTKLRAGDVLTIQMSADDFDDVTYAKAPGRSHQLELHIVAPQALEALLQHEQARVRQEVLKLQQLQRDARAKVADAAEQHAATGQLRPEDRDQLMQAEQLQGQIRSRVGTEQEGLRAELGRIRQAHEDNKLPPSPGQDRMATVARELERLAREELEPIEPLLSAARENTAPAPNEANAAKKNPLAEAQRHQQEVEKTLDAILQRLEPWSGANEVRGETRALLNELERLQEQTRQLAQQLPSGTSRERLTPQQQAELDKASTRQEALANQTRQLLDKIDRLAEEKQRLASERLQEAGKQDAAAAAAEKLAQTSADRQEQARQRQEAQRLREQAEDQKDAAASLHQEAAALQQTAKSGKEELQSKSGASESRNQTRLDEAAADLRQNRLGNAQDNQQQGAQALREMLERLEERRQDDLDRLQRKIRQAEQKLDELADRQERLQKKVRAAQQLADPVERAQELERLARAQEKLRQEARELAQELSRLQAPEAGKALSRSAREMGDARQRLERGEKADEAQDDALQRIDEAQDQLEKAREQIEEELLREKLVKITKRIEGIRERQKRALDESGRLHDDALVAKKWERDRIVSLLNLREVEEGLAAELEGLIEKRFRQEKVIAKLLDHTAAAMRHAGRTIGERVEDIKNRSEEEPFDLKLEQRLQSETVRWQQTALRRLDQFRDALKPDKELARSAQAAQGNQPKDGSGGGKSGGNAGGGQDSDALPPLAQLRALRMLQAEANEQTEKFAKEHPDPSKLSEAEKSELQSLQNLQRDIAELIQEFAPAEAPKEDRP